MGVPQGYSLVDGAVLETQVVIRSNGEETVIPLPLTEDIRAFRLQLRNIVAKTFVIQDGQRSPELTLVLVQHAEVPRGVRETAEAKFGKRVRAEFTITTRCGPYCMDTMDDGNLGIFQIDRDGSPQLRASTNETNVDVMIDVFVARLPEELATPFVGINDPLAKRLQARD
jgi:hypothetical protein